MMILKKIGFAILSRIRSAIVSRSKWENTEEIYIMALPIGYIKNQIQEDMIADQISVKEYKDPFKGD